MTCELVPASAWVWAEAATIEFYDGNRNQRTWGLQGYSWLPTYVCLVIVDNFKCYYLS